MALTAHEPLFIMSAQQPWAYLMANGYKKCENREGHPPETSIGAYVAIHATKIKTERTRHAAYQIPLVQHYLGLIRETQDICGDNKALDDFFEQSMRSVIGIVKLEAAIDKKHMDPEERRAAQQQYPFFDVGRVTNRKLLLGQSYSFPNPIPNVKGGLGVRILTDADTLEKVRKGMADIQGAIKRMRQQQDHDEEDHDEEEKGHHIPDDDDSDDDVCPTLDKVTAGDKPRFEKKNVQQFHSL